MFLKFKNYLPIMFPVKMNGTAKLRSLLASPPKEERTHYKKRIQYIVIYQV